VNYFAVGHSSECFSFIKDWVEKKVRRHMGRAQKPQGLWDLSCRGACLRRAVTVAAPVRRATMPAKHASEVQGIKR
jgi:hypothetical protein